MTTEAGKRLLADWRHYDDCANVAAPLSNVDPVCISRESELREYIAAIEAEAVAAERARIVEGVRGLTQYAFSLYDDGTDDRITVSLAATLAIIEEKP